jgi:cytosine/adenosine deaminase-related metal-dependent hydrolase
MLLAATEGAASSMATPIAPASIQVGAVCDIVAVASASVRTAGSAPDQLPMTATAADVSAVVINGELVVEDGVHLRLGSPAKLLTAAINNFSTS